MIVRGTGREFLAAVNTPGANVSRRVDGSPTPVLWAEDKGDEILYAVAIAGRDTMCCTASAEGLMDWGQWSDGRRT